MVCVISWAFFFILLLCSLQIIYARNHHHYLEEEKPSVYLNKFAVKIDGGNAEATEIAAKYGFINLGKVRYIS